MKCRSRTSQSLRRKEQAARVSSETQRHTHCVSTGRTSAHRSTGEIMTTMLRQRAAWKALERHHDDVSRSHLRELFAADPGRAERFTVDAAGLHLDYSKNRITDETVRLLLQLADECELRKHIDAMFRGEHINVSEKRAVLHAALRMPAEESLIVDGKDVVAGSPRGARPDVSIRGTRAHGTVEGPHGKAHSQRHQHRHRRLRPRSGDGLRSAPLLLEAGHDFPLRVERRLDRLRRGDAATSIQRRRSSSSRRRRSARSRR